MTNDDNLRVTENRRHSTSRLYSTSHIILVSRRKFSLYIQKVQEMRDASRSVVYLHWIQARHLLHVNCRFIRTTPPTPRATSQNDFNFSFVPSTEINFHGEAFSDSERASSARVNWQFIVCQTVVQSAKGERKVRRWVESSAWLWVVSWRMPKRHYCRLEEIKNENSLLWSSSEQQNHQTAIV